MTGLSSPIYLPRMRPLPVNKSVIVSVLDVGTSKVCCLIARLIPRTDDQIMAGRTHEIKLLGFGYQRSEGIKSGTVINLDRADNSIRLAVEAAERMAGVTVESIIVNLTSKRAKSEIFVARVNLSRDKVRDADIQRVLAASSMHTVEDGSAIVHAIPISYELDGNSGIFDPRGMIGHQLGVDMHIVTTDIPTVSNLELCINRGHLHVETLVSTPYASGLSTLVTDESELGAACIDMGGGTTSLSVFANRQIVHLDAIPIGGNHVTKDIAQGLSTQIEIAERLKILNGSAFHTAEDESELISVPSLDDDDEVDEQISRSELTRIIQPRIEEIFELIRDCLTKSGFAEQIGKRFVLTGGACQLPGVIEVARNILGSNARVGRPLGITGLPVEAKGPAFGTAVGLLVYPQIAQIEQFEPRSTLTEFASKDGSISRIIRWIKDSF